MASWQVPDRPAGWVARYGRIWDLVGASVVSRGATAVADAVCAVGSDLLARDLVVPRVALTLPDGRSGAQVLAASDEWTRRLEEMQIVLGEGPSLEVLAGGSAIRMGDLRLSDPRGAWPMFRREAADCGATGVFVCPMARDAVRCGVLAVYLKHGGAMPSEAESDARTLAAVALDLMLAATEEADSALSVLRLLGDRVEIHQAVGMVSAQLGIGTDEALLRMRVRAFAEACALSEVAAAVVGGLRLYGA